DHSSNDGWAKARGVVDDGDTAGDLTLDLLTNAVSLTVTDGDAFVNAFSLTNCKGRRGAAIHCRSGDGRTRATFRPINGTLSYTMNAKARRLATGARPGVSPSKVTVVLHQGVPAHERPDAVSACGPLGATRLDCLDH